MPMSLIEETALIGPKKIRDDLEAWRESCVTTMLLYGDANTLRTMAELSSSAGSARSDDLFGVAEDQVSCRRRGSSPRQLDHVPAVRVRRHGEEARVDGNHSHVTPSRSTSVRSPSSRWFCS